jgi:hypothetical protein
MSLLTGPLLAIYCVFGLSQRIHGSSFLFPRYVDSVIRGSGRGEEPSGANVPSLIRIRLNAFDWFAAIVVSQENRFRNIPATVRNRRFRSCRNLIRTLPTMCYDPRHVEDIDGPSEDHCVDALHYGLTRVKHFFRSVRTTGL